MHEIAEKAEFGIGTLYSFFENKEALYKALAMECAERFHSALGVAIREGRDEYEKILNFARTKGEVFMTNAKAVRLYFAEMRGASFNIRAGLDETIQEMYEKFLEELADLFAAGIKRGIFREVDPYYLAVSLDSLTNTFLFCWLKDPERHNYRANIPVMMSIFFEQMRLDNEE